MPTSSLDPRYRCQRLVGQGAFGDVYEGLDQNLDRRVAIKLLTRLVGDEPLERFRQEAETLAAHPHPGLVPILDLDLEARPPYVVLEWMPGGDLAGWIDPGPRPRDRAVLAALAGVAGALDHLHQRGVLHRDLKPENVLLRQDGSPAIADLGLARPQEDRGLTRTGHVVGTPAYMAPEVLGEGRYSAQSDLFAFGALALELWTGVRLRAPASVPGQVDDRLAEVQPPALRALLARCLDPDPRGRPRRGHELEQRLLGLATSAASTQLVSARPGPTPPAVHDRTPRPPPAASQAAGGRPRLVASLVACLLALALGLVWPGSGSGPPAPDPPSPPAEGPAPSPPGPDRPAAAAHLRAAQGGLGRCQIGQLFTVPEQGDPTPALRVADQLVAPECTQAAAATFEALGRWLQAAPPPGRGEGADEAGPLLSRGGPVQALRSLHEGVEDLSISLERLAFLTPKAAPVLLERRGWVEDLRTDLTQRALDVADRLPVDPAACADAPLVARLLLLDSVSGALEGRDGSLGSLGALAREAGRRLAAGAVPAPVVGPMVDALAGALDRRRGQLVEPTDSLTCEDRGRLVPLVVRQLRGAQVTPQVRFHWEGFGLLQAAAAEARCPAGDLFEPAWVEDQLRELRGRALAAGDPERLTRVVGPLRRGPGGETAAVQGWVEGLSLPLAPGLEGFVVVPPPYGGGEGRGVSAPVVQALDEAIDDLAGCLPAARVEPSHGLDRFQAAAERLVSDECQAKVAGVHPLVRAWLDEVEVAEGMPGDPAEVERLFDRLMRRGPLSYGLRLRSVEAYLERAALEDLRALVRLNRVGKQAVEALRGVRERWRETLAEPGPVDDSRRAAPSGVVAMLRYLSSEAGLFPEAPPAALVQQMLYVVLDSGSQGLRSHAMVALADRLPEAVREPSSGVTCDQAWVVLEALAAVCRRPEFAQPAVIHGMQVTAVALQLLQLCPDHAGLRALAAGRVARLDPDTARHEIFDEAFGPITRWSSQDPLPPALLELREVIRARRAAAR